jgi:transaldolase
LQLADIPLNTKGETVKFFVDTADLDEIREAASWGALAGVTTNPTLYARLGATLADFPEHIKRICAFVKGPVSAESTAVGREEIIREGRALAALADNVVVKIAATAEGLAATRALADEGIRVNMTLCFTVPQALLAARAGARYVSPFVGRYDDISEDGVAQLENIVCALGNYDFRDCGPRGESIEVIAASIRSAHHVTQAACVGADIATVPFAVLKKCLEHPLTDKGLVAFDKDWEKVKKA